jgi:NCS1 family nucleobase:cation symporter-1
MATPTTSTSATDPVAEHGYSERLYNEDLAPRTLATWGVWDLFCWWMSAWHSLGGYTFAIGLLVLGLNGWQMIVAAFIGILVIYAACNMMGIAGQRLGVPFPVFARASFGVYGANIPAIMRAVVAIAWYAIQTYLASLAVMTLVLKLYPAAESLTGPSFVGLSALGWICFLLLWAVQLAVLYRGMETVRKFSDLAGPVLWVAMAALAIWILSRAGWSLDWNYREGSAQEASGGSLVAFLSAISLTIAYMGGPMLNFADFTRFSPDKKAIKRGNLLGLPLNATAFVLVSVVIALASAEVYGSAVTDPIELVADIDSVVAVLVAVVGIAGSAVGINIILNFVSPAYDIANIAPKYLSFRTGGVITAILALLILPWKIYSSPVAVNLFIGGVGALMGPLFGAMMADYYIVRKATVEVDDLYRDQPDSRYFYQRGTNLNTVIAMLPASVITLVIALVPVFSAVAPFSWPIGAALGAVFCILVNRMRPNARARALDLSAEAEELRGSGRGASRSASN